MDPRSTSDARVLPGSPEVRDGSLVRNVRQNYQKSAIVMRRERRLHDAIKEESDYTAKGLRGFANQEQIKQQLRWKLMNDGNPLAAGNNIKTAVKQTRVATIGFGLLAWYAWFYLLQLGFGIIYMLAIYAENETLWGWVLPGQTLAYVAWAVASVTSLTFMLIGAFTYLATATNIFRWQSILMFIIGCCGSLVPYFNVIPWLALWIFTLFDTKHSHSDT